MLDAGFMVQVAIRIVSGHVMAGHIHGCVGGCIQRSIHLHLHTHGPGRTRRYRQPQHEQEANDFFHGLKIAHFIAA